MELSEEKIESLIMGFFEDRLSEEELRDFREWMESDSAHSAYVRSLKSINDKRECGDLNVDDSWRRLALKIDDRKRMKRRFTVRLAVGIAAGLLLLLSVGISLFSLDSTDIVGERQRKQFAYSTQRSVAYVELPDGTSVHLAPNTEFRYFDDYGDDERRVFLDGEGYFEVQKESRCPFVVVSGDQEIIVTGTKFNVRSYSEDNESVTTLLEGSITFRSDRMRKTINLQPKEQVRYNDESQTISVKYVPDAANAILWMDSRYVFENDSLADILDRMQNLYEVKFVCTNEKALNSTYKVTFYQDESLDDFLRVVGKMSDLSAVEKGDTVYLK